MALIDATRQYDAGGSIYFGAVFWSGLIMTVVFLAGYVYVFLRVWPGVKHQKEKRKAQQDEERAKHPLGLDEALSLLIMDHIEERRSRRAQHQEERGKTSTASSSSKSSSQEHRGGMPPTGFA